MSEALKLFVFLEKYNIEHHFDYIDETNYLAWISIYQIEEFYDLLEDMLVYFDEHIPILLQAERLICVNLSGIFEDIDFVEFAELTGNGG